MAANYDKMFKIAYCNSQESGDWGDPKEFESMERVALGCEVVEDGHYSSTTDGLHPVLGWNETMGADQAGMVAPGQLAQPKPGLTMVTLNANMVKVGKLYEAFTGCTDKGNLINFKIFFFRTKYPQTDKKKEQLHHFFSITGIAGRIAGLYQTFGGGGESVIQLNLSPNRISWYDHDNKCGGKLGWDAPSGKQVRPMPMSPI